MKARRRANKRFSLLWRNLEGCVAFLALAAFGALLGHAVAVRGYAESWGALLLRLPVGVPPESAPVGALAMGVLIPAFFCACMGVSGYSKRLLPLWGFAVLLLGAFAGLKTGTARCVLEHEFAVRFGVAVVLSAVLPAPLALYMALLPLDRLKRMEEPFFPTSGDGFPSTVLVTGTLLVTLELAVGTAVQMIGLHTLFH